MLAEFEGRLYYQGGPQDANKTADEDARAALAAFIIHEADCFHHQTFQGGPHLRSFSASGDLEAARCSSEYTTVTPASAVTYVHTDYWGLGRARARGKSNGVQYHVHVRRRVGGNFQQGSRGCYKCGMSEAPVTLVADRGYS